MTGTLLITSPRHAFLFCDGLMAPALRTGTTRLLEASVLHFLFADFLEIWFKSVPSLDGNLAPVDLHVSKKIILLLSHQKFPSFDITKGCLKKCHVIEKIRDQYPFKKPNKIRDGDFPAFGKNNIMKELIMRMGIAWRSSEAQTTQTNGLNNQRLTEPDAL